MEIIQPRPIVLHLSAVPAKIMVIAFYICNMMHGAFHRGHSHMGNGCKTGWIQLFRQGIQFFMVFHQLLGNAPDQDLVGNSPETDRGVIVILNDQFFQLADTILMGFGIFVEHTDKGDLRPDNKSQLVAGVIEILGMLIMCQTDSVCPQLFDQLCVLVVVFSCQSVPFIKHILMAAHAPQRRLFSVDDKSLLRIAGKAADACFHRNLIICLVSSLERCLYCIKIRAVDLPFLCLRHIKGNARTVRRAAAAGSFSSLCVQNRVQHCKVFISIFHIRNNFKFCSAAVTGLWRYLDTGASIIFQIKMRIRHADQVHASVKPAVKGKVCRLGIYAVFIGIAAGNYQKIFSFFPAPRSNIRPEDGIAAFMISSFLPVYIYRRLLSGSQDLHKYPSSGQRLSGRLEGFCIPVSASVIGSVAVLPVNSIPGMRQLYGLPVYRQAVRKSCVLLDKFPVLVKIDHLSHKFSSFFLVIFLLIDILPSLLQKRKEYFLELFE